MDKNISPPSQGTANNEEEAKDLISHEKNNEEKEINECSGETSNKNSKSATDASSIAESPSDVAAKDLLGFGSSAHNFEHYNKHGYNLYMPCSHAAVLEDKTTCETHPTSERSSLTTFALEQQEKQQQLYDKEVSHLQKQGESSNVSSAGKVGGAKQNQRKRTKPKAMTSDVDSDDVSSGDSQESDVNASNFESNEEESSDHDDHESASDSDSTIDTDPEGNHDSDDDNNDSDEEYNPSDGSEKDAINKPNKSSGSKKRGKKKGNNASQKQPKQSRRQDKKPKVIAKPLKRSKARKNAMQQFASNPASQKAGGTHMVVTSIAIPGEQKIAIFFDLCQYRQNVGQNISNWLFKPLTLVSVFTCNEEQQQFYKLPLPRTAKSANCFSIRKESCSSDNVGRGRLDERSNFWNDSVFCLADKFNSTFEDYETKVQTIHAGFHRTVTHKQFKRAYPDAYQAALTSSEPSKMAALLSDKNARIYSDIAVVPAFKSLQALDELLTDEAIIEFCNVHCTNMLTKGYKHLNTEQKTFLYLSGKLPRVFKEAFS